MNKRIIIIGGGLAGLAAGIRILEKDSSCKVTIYNMGHHPGGKAASWRDEKGFNVDHGFHAIFSGYKRMRKLFRRAGVKSGKTFVSSRGVNYFYEEDTGKIHQLNPTPIARYSGYPAGEYLKIASFGISSSPDIFLKSGETLEQYDEECYTAWALERGLDKEFLKKRWFRFTQDALFNWPYEVSAYITIMGTRLTKSPIYQYVNGNYGENIIAPIVKYFEQLGGKLIRQKKLVEILHDDKKVTGIKLADPDPALHACGKNQWTGAVPVIPESVTIEKEFDGLVLTLPVDCFKELNIDDKFFWKGFDGIKNLTSVVTLSWQLWTNEPVMPPHCHHINGLDEPMGTLADYKNIADEYRYNSEIGSALEWVGQETGFEQYSDEELKAIIIKAFLKVPWAKDPRKAGIIHDVFNRNKAHHDRYLLTDPGTLKFRPHTKTHFANMFLAGDWIRNEVDVPCMEGAICSGYNAADAAINMLKNNTS